MTDVEDLRGEFLSDTEAWQSEHTYRGRKSATKFYLEWIDEKNLKWDEVTAKHIRKWLTEQLNDDYAPRTIRQKAYAVSAMYEFAKEENLIDDEYNPIQACNRVQKLEKTQVSDSRGYLEIGEYTKLREASNSLRDRMVIVSLWTLGCRRVELVNITLDDINRDKKTVTIENAKREEMSEDDERTIGYPPEFESMICKWVDDNAREGWLGANESDKLIVTREGDMEPDRVTKIVRETAERAGIQKVMHEDYDGNNRYWVRPHLLRKSYGIHRVRSGLSLAMLQVALGHRDISVTRDVYLNFRKKERNQQLRATAPNT